jgi:hypothetical protein
MYYQLQICLYAFVEQTDSFYLFKINRAIRSISGSIKMASVRFMDSFLSFYVILAFPLWKNGFLILFSGETTYPYTQYMYIMSGVLEHLIRPQKKVVVYRNPKELELQTAKEILAEVFMVRLSEVDEMLQNRFHAEDTDKMGSKEDGLYPQELWVE